MNIYLSVFLVLQFYGSISSQNIISTDNDVIKEGYINDKLNHMDVLIEDLSNQQWDHEESICLQKLLDIMNNVKNSTLWAVWVWDSMQIPAGLLYGSEYSLGKYDQCMNPPWLESHPEFRTQYCLADIKLSETDSNNRIGDPYKSVQFHINSVTKHRLKFNKIIWGVCVPAACNAKSTSNFIGSLLKDTYLGPEIHKIDVVHCKIAGATEEYTWGLYLLIILIIAILIITVSCTIINNTRTSSNDNNGNKFLKAFCLTTNISSLNKISRNDINVLHGIRALSSFVVLSLHVVFMKHAIGFGNALTFDKDMDRFKIKALFRLEYTVDIFLLMSGLLRIKTYMAVGQINPFKAILKRYLRYVVTIAVLIMIVLEVHDLIGDGPIWNFLGDKETAACKKNWLITLLMLGNYIDNLNICFPVSWTVPCDFHFSVLATLLYWLYQKNRKMAITGFSILMTASLILPGVVTYQRNLLKILAFDFTITGNYKKMLSTDTYMLSHLRGAPYFIGMALGYFMSTYKPNRHRNMFSKLTSTIGITVALTIAAINIYVVGGVQDNPDSNEFSSFVVSSIHRFIFTLAISGVIVFCEYGNVPLLGSVLTWPGFIPISKLSFGIYLVHSMIYTRMIAITRSPLHYDALLMILDSVALMGVSCLGGLLLFLFLEAPTNKITDIMIDIKADTEEKNKTETTSEFKNGVSHSNEIKKNI